MDNLFLIPVSPNKITFALETPFQQFSPLTPWGGRDGKTPKLRPFYSLPFLASRASWAPDEADWKTGRGRRRSAWDAALISGRQAPAGGKGGGGRRGREGEAARNGRPEIKD